METQAQTAVTGSYFLVDQSIRLQAQVVDATTGAVLGAVSPVVVPRDSVQRGVRLLRDRVMGMLAVRADERLRDVPGMLERPPTYEAYRAFDRGIRLYNAQEYADASRVLRESWQLDTTFLIPLVYAATAAWNRGEYATTDSLVKMLRARQSNAQRVLRPERDLPGEPPRGRGRPGAPGGAAGGGTGARVAGARTTRRGSRCSPIIPPRRCRC